MGVIANIGTSKGLMGGLFSGMISDAPNKVIDNNFRTIKELKGEIKALGKNMEAAGSKEELKTLTKKQDDIKNKLEKLLSPEKQKNTFMSAMTIPLTDVLVGIKKGIDKLVSFSPLLNAEMKKFNVGFRFFMMPIGNTISNFLQPWIMKFNRMAFKFFEDYMSGGLLSAFGKLLETAGKFALEKPEEALELAAGLIIGGVAVKGGIGLIKAVAGWLGLSTGVGAAGGMGLVIPAALFLGSFALGELFGLGDSSAIIAAIATGAGLLTAALTGGGLAVAIPTALALVGIPAFAKIMGDALVDVMGGGRDIIKEELGEKAAFEVGDIWEGALRDLNKGQGTVSMMFNPITEQFELLPNTAEVAGKNIVKNFNSTAVAGFENSSKDMKVTFNDVLSSIMGWLTGEDKSVSTELKAVGSTADNEGQKIQTLSDNVNALPNVDRYITYHVKYVEEEET